MCIFCIPGDSGVNWRTRNVRSMTIRAVACAWCNGEMRVPDPIAGGDGYFVLPRRCRHCAGNNIGEIDDGEASVQQQRRQRRKQITQRIVAVKPLVA